MTSIEVQNNDKIKKIFADAYDSNTANILPSFDVIIDDGPHTLESQEKAIQLYLPKVNPGGIFIIEDIQEESSIDVLRNSVPEELKKYCEFIDLRTVKGRRDDMMFVVHVPPSKEIHS